MTDPADIQAKARRKLQLTRELGRPREERPHPSTGGAAGFPVWRRKEILEDYHNGLPHFINVNEFAMEAKRLNSRSKAWGISFQRVCLIGNYGKNKKLTVMLDVEAGDPNIPNHLVAGTTGDGFAALVGTICSAVENYGDEQRVSLWDNLSSHYSGIVYETVLARGGPTQFNVLPRPAYQPKYGPIEYVICELVNYLKINTRGPVDLDDIEQQIIQAAAGIGPFNNTFAHCGYSENGTYPGVNLPDPPQALDWELLGLPSIDTQAPDWELLGLPDAELHG
eukprot:jgi/Psemu1/28266/gm1.28266_g